MPEPTPTTGIELKLDNGMVIKGENAEEALKSAAKIIEDNVKYSRETKAQLDSLQQQFSTYQAEHRPAPVPTTGFQKEKYYELLNNDPLSAQNYLDAARFGIQPEEVVPRFNGMYEKISVLDGQTLAATFTNTHPEFPADNDSAQKLTGRIRELQQQGHPTDLHTMDIAYQQLVHEGTIKPLETQVQPPEELPPSLGGTGSVISESELKKAETLSDAELMALLKSKGML